METLEQLKTGSPEKAAMASMYDQTFQNFEEGSVIEGTVVAVKKDAVIVDIGYKSEGIISAEEFTPQELAALTPGTRLPVYIEEREDSEGNLILRSEKAAMASMYDQTFQNFEEGSVIEGTVVAVKKDAVIVDIGYKSEGIISAEEFTPQELAALTPGTRLPVYIEEREDSEGNLIL